jgi:hypothetical protein
MLTTTLLRLCLGFLPLSLIKMTTNNLAKKNKRENTIRLQQPFVALV